MGQPLKGVPKRELLGEALQGVVGVSFLGNGQLLEGLECVRGCHRSVAVPFFCLLYRQFGHKKPVGSRVGFEAGLSSWALERDPEGAYAF
jgi:hypothetical protein